MTHRAPLNGPNPASDLSAQKARILVVDDEEDVRDVLRYNLAREGYHVFQAETGEQALESARLNVPDLILLDLMLPGVDGLEVCRRLKQSPETSHIPIIMVTAKGEDVDMVVGLESGADDYVTKPFSPRVLLARIRAVLRKATASTSDPQDGTLLYGELRISVAQHEARIRSKRLDLTATEFRILLTLARRPGWVFSREQIVDAARGENTVVTSRSVDVHIVRLRSKLGALGTWIETVRSIGYRFSDEARHQN